MKWECKSHVVVCTKVQKAGHIWEDLGRCGSDIEYAVQEERD